MNIKKYGTKELSKDYGPLTFGNALEAHRKCEEMSQKEFALKLKISAQSLCDIEKGRRIPSPIRAAKIAKQISQPEKFWIQLVFQDMLRREQLNYTVSVA
ncbi:MAG: helix-turn-helix domain-containing protein [Proteobacteria bacterium]|nr:helix-turn-helix domain-containing protein [Pseudomonadota bacterium]MBU1696503.1 helix-turn-helix domain-containing protein [Pseudomonadota bacterium]